MRELLIGLVAVALVGCMDTQRPAPFDVEGPPTAGPSFGKGGKGGSPPPPEIGAFFVFDQDLYKGEWHWSQGATVVWDETQCFECTYAWQYFQGADWQNPTWEERHWPTGTNRLLNEDLTTDEFCPPAWLLGQTIRIGNHVWQGVPPDPPERSPSHPNHLGHTFQDWTITRLCE